MPRGNVALLAETGHTGFQQLRARGTVRFMAVHAIFHHGRMLPQEGTAPLRVTRVTILVDRALDQQLGIGSAMRIMAIRAGDLSFSKRHVRRAHHLSTAQLVALKADFHSRFLDELTVPRQRLIKTERGNVGLHDLVTGNTGQAAGFVGAPFPKQPRALFMALQTLGVEFLDGAVGFLVKPNNGVYISSPLDVGAPGSVTGFAASFFDVGFGVVQKSPTHGCVLPALKARIMAGSAGLASHVVRVASCLWTRSWAGGFARACTQ